MCLQRLIKFDVIIKSTFYDLCFQLEIMGFYLSISTNFSRYLFHLAPFGSFNRSLRYAI